jgi:hypothetical protein
MRRQPITKSLAIVAALSACAVAAPMAFAHTDIAPPATSKAVVVNQPAYNVAPPDASKAVVVTQQPSTSSSDLRSPDGTAAAADPRSQSYATPTVIKVGSDQVGSDSGFGWGDAGIGALIMLAVVALAGGGIFLVTRRRTMHASVPTATS